MQICNYYQERYNVDLYDELIKRIDEKNEQRIHEITWEVSQFNEEENEVFFHQCLDDLCQLLEKLDLRQAMADQRDCKVEEVSDSDRDIYQYFIRLATRLWDFTKNQHICEDCKEAYYRFKSWADYNL